jgi:SprT protein
MRLSPLVAPARTTRKRLPDPLSRENLSGRIPETAVDYTYSWMKEHPVRLVLKKDRSSKSGDYRQPVNGSSAVITVNRNLNPYHFLVTLIHEMAHHAVYLDWAERSRLKFPFSRPRRPKPHGKEWKRIFREMFLPLLESGIFPQELNEEMLRHMADPKASTAADHKLLTLLKSFDEPDGSVAVETLPADALFRLPDGRIFIKKEKARKRYKCLLHGTKRMYLFQPGARVFRV